MLDISIESALDEYAKLIQQALEKASKQAVKATANDVVKITLPNTLNNTDKSKPASKQKGTFSKNIKALKQRIKQNIIGNGIEGQGIPTSVPSAKGNPLKAKTKGKIYMPYVLIAKPKGSKRRIKIKGDSVKTEMTAKGLADYIQRNTDLVSDKITYRKKKKGSEIFWITKSSIAKQAAGLLQQRAGNLLSGWTALANRAAESEGNILNGLLGSQRVDRDGSATIKTDNGKVVLDATNREVGDKVKSYQQNVIDRSIPNSMKYHLENAIKHINFNALRNQVRKSITK